MGFGGFTLIRHGFAVPPSPVKGEGLSVRLSRLLCSGASASVRAFPLTGEGGWPSGQTDEGEKPPYKRAAYAALFF